MKTILALTNRADRIRVWSGRLADSGFRIVGAMEAPDTLEALAAERPDLILVDLVALGDAGLELCRRIRPLPTVPVLALAGRIRQAEQAVTVERIADDFVLVAGTPRELATRVRALVGRVTTATQPDPLRLGDLLISSGNRSVSVAGEPVDLTVTELELLTALAADPGNLAGTEPFRA